jgi:hypothetical protein
MQASETPQVAAIVVLDNEGGRIACKYFSKDDFPDLNTQSQFEAKLFKKTKNAAARSEAEVVVIDGLTVVYRMGSDATFAVVGNAEENELVLVAVLDALVEALLGLLKGQTDKRTLLHHLELVLLSIDELVDGGVPFELDPAAIESRVMLRGAVPESISSYSEMTVNQLMDKARDKLQKQLAK